MKEKTIAHVYWFTAITIIVIIAVLITIVMLVIIVVVVVTESPFEVEFYPEPQSFYRTNFLWLFSGR